MEDRDRLNNILREKNSYKAIKGNLEYITEIIPEIKNMIGFEHKHPHHNLDVWEHTLKVVEELEDADLETRMAALLHDIGKPFSYQDEEVRHFHGHPEVSKDMTEKILKRLGYDDKFIKDVCYLVEIHDNIIDPNNLDNTDEMIDKRLKLQYADAKAHSPDKVAKRIRFLDNIKKEIINMRTGER